MVITICLIVLGATIGDLLEVTRDQENSKRTSINILRKYITCFSLRNTWKGLMRVDNGPTSLKCIHAIRVLSMGWVMLGHRYISNSYFPSSNLFDLWTKYIYQWSNMVVLNAFLAVDTFLLMSGLLLSYHIACNYVIRGTHMKFVSLPGYYIYRYIRLTVPLAVVVFLSATLVEHVSHGPTWGIFVREGMTKPCQTNWWKTLIYINNYAADGGVCVGQSWYLSIDMQLSWLAPLLLLPLTRWPRYTLLAIALLTLGSVAAVFTVTYLHDLSWTFSVLNGVQQATDFSKYVYVNTPMRASPYLCGMALGYLLARCLHDINIKNRFKRMSRAVVAIGWVASIAACLTVVFVLSVYYEQGIAGYDNLKAAFYASLHRLAWALGISWLIFACVTERGGPVGYLLSCNAWQPLSRLCYCVFLTHLTIMFMEGATWRNANYISNYTIVHGYLGDLIIIGLPALLLYLSVEAPCSSILRLTLKRSKQKS